MAWLGLAHAWPRKAGAPWCWGSVARAEVSDEILAHRSTSISLVGGVVFSLRSMISGAAGSEHRALASPCTSAAAARQTTELFVRFAKRPQAFQEP